MVRTRRQAVDAEEDAEGALGLEGVEERRVTRAEAEAEAEAEAGRRRTLVQTALAGVASDYVIPDHEPGEQFPGRQSSTTQLSLFETGFKRKSGQLSLLESGLKRMARWDEIAGSGCVRGC